MWAPHDTPPPVEKIRKAQWTSENTKQTQRVVSHLAVGAKALEMVFGSTCPAVRDMRAAVRRFIELDPAVTWPDGTEPQL